MINELQILEEVNHPNIPRVLELIHDDANYYIISEAVTGGNLMTRLNADPSVTEEQSAHIIHQILLALNYMHKLGIVHRDIKPQNILCVR